MKKLFARIKNSVSNWSIRYKILSAFIVLVLVPSLSIGFITYFNVSENLEDEAYESSANVLKQASVNIEYILDNMEYMANGYANNSFILDIFKASKYDRLSLSDEIDYFLAMRELISVNQKANPYIFLTRFYFYGDAIYINDMVNFYPIDSINETQLYKTVLESVKATGWTGVYNQYYIFNKEANIISFGKSVKNPTKISEEIGFVLIDVEKDNFQKILDDVNIPDSALIMIHGKGWPIAKKTGDAFTGDISDEALVEMLSEEDSLVEISGVKYMRIHEKIEDTDWDINYIIPYSYVKKSSSQLLAFTLILILVFCMVAILAAIVFSKAFTKGIINLANKMKHMNDVGELTPVEVTSSDEIGTLSKLYNTMIERIDSLLINVYEMKLQKRDMELKVLEGQINPHFLYNTLDAVKWTALKGESEAAAEMAENLSHLFRLSLNRGQEILTVGEEIEHVEAYVKIQNIRMDNAVNWVNNINKDMYSYKTIKLILQPIVENAFIHGMQKKRGHKGKVTLESYSDGNCLCFVVKDDGAGMTETQINNILNVSTAGYGVYNVNERIKLYYGSEYGLIYESVLGKGTTVTIRIKKTE